MSQPPSALLWCSGKLSKHQGRFQWLGNWYAGDEIGNHLSSAAPPRRLEHRFFTPFSAKLCSRLHTESDLLPAEFVEEEGEADEATSNPETANSTPLVTPNSATKASELTSLQVTSTSLKSRANSFDTGLSPAVSVGDDDSTSSSLSAVKTTEDEPQTSSSPPHSNESNPPNHVSSTESSPSSSPMRGNSEDSSHGSINAGGDKEKDKSLSRKVSVSELTQSAVALASTSPAPVTPANNSFVSSNAVPSSSVPPSAPTPTPTKAASTTAPLHPPAAPAIPSIPLSSSYANGPYEDAGVKYPDLCPIGGTFKGFFENSPKKSGRVFERFVLYINSRKTFTNPDGADLQRCFHVCGSGSNKFGVFMLSGTFNPVSLLLKVVRIYMAAGTKLPAATAAALNMASSYTQKRPREKQKRPPTIQEGNVLALDPNESRKTRKKQLSWQRHDGDSDLSAFADLPLRGPVKKKGKPGRKPGWSPGPRKPGANPRKPGPKPKNGGKAAIKSSDAMAQPKLPSRPAFPLPKLPVTQKHPVPPPPNPRMCTWRSAFYFNESKEIYEGELLNSQRHGFGVFVYKNGHIYEGSWRKNLEHGSGTIFDAKRQIVYTGEFEKGRLTGQGTYFFSDGGKYTGEFRDNLRHGTGEYRYPNKNVYVGEWKDDLFWGKGKYTWANGEGSFDGDWLMGMRHGKGMLKLPDGFSYDGQWVQDAMEGRGNAVYPNKQTYNGQFHQSLRDGRGTSTFSNGGVYEGRFKNDKIEGSGTFSLSNVVKVSGEGEKIEEGTGKDLTEYMIPVTIADMKNIHVKSGFTAGGC
ncbi:hypothetical protein TrVE_jg4502 [Triparma verrucosa]|uniref:Uncharacterized protein n=1 Tax=Triparma verrucosa TaxID=1606542 RepID=A0A9W7FFL5_9STRA|nr:hypothetical protein TrVE_jg4502 [Triparma verrucosa]